MNREGLIIAVANEITVPKLQIFYAEEEEEDFWMHYELNVDAIVDIHFYLDSESDHATPKVEVNVYATYTAEQNNAVYRSTDTVSAPLNPEPIYIDPIKYKGAS